MTELVSRSEAEELLGYAPRSLKVVMQQQPGRWPAPVACRARGARALLYDLDALRAAAARTRGTLRGPDGADPDGLVTCLSCGRRFRSLGPHLARAHQTTAAEYRAEHQLPATTALMARDTRADLQRTRQALMETDPEVVKRMREAAPPPEEIASRSADARAGTDDLPAVREARRRGAAQTLPLANAARRERLEAVARAAGYDSMRDAVEQTRDVPSRAAAERIGVGVTTVKRWRKKLSETP
ncbi:MucR family transcriptional regulator [Streptomyces sp. DSM 44917]|uniref:MucR family transcriptional regulator n=1 Tax=Streptomyces boetiae TaxID=3075541 RepID=A0ABU2L3J9_9ACTN|nr:MucR family transcriptional regulator [Streptomyces sp. DSM 44917]MDT0306141.1 MucR family transcriptional regulator [Streptomyces sp. DSM 44917]